MSRPALLNSRIGNYLLIDFVGEGGMGEVYRATHSRIGRVVAIKVLSSSLADSSFLERFRDEARIQAGLQHQNIATLYDFLEYEDRSCIVMEYVEGETLAQRLREVGPLQAREALRIFRAVVEAIEYVHSQGVIHRDIKSNNIKITPAGRVKVLDFGISKSGSSPALTVTGGVVGTLQYLSPEQIRGTKANEQTDIWALGVLFYEMVTGHMPFEADTIGSLLDKINRCNYRPPSMLNESVPAEVQAVISRCLKKQPSDRYPSASALLRDLGADASKPQSASTIRRAFLALTETVRPLRLKPKTLVQLQVSPVEVGSSASRRRRLLLLAVGIALALFVGLYFLLNGPSEDQVKTITIKVTGSEANVLRDGRKIGTTPYRLSAKPGELIDVTLRRDGYEDCPVRFTVTENRKDYQYTLTERE
jgi:serine/threonine-protein kinase